MTISMGGGYNDGISIDEYTTKELLKELKSRDVVCVEKEVVVLIEKIYFLRRNGEDYQRELDKLIELSIGRY